jgi:hypothetical protein
MDKDIGKINKGEFQGAVTEIVVAVKEYNGRVGVDIRECVTSDKYTGPTKKGLRIPAEKFQEFKQMINSISQGDLKASESSGSSESFEKHSAPKKQKQLDEDIPDY